MATPEGRIKAKVKALLKQFGAYWHMPVSNGMGAPALDFHGCHKARYYAIETKAGNKQMTPRQASTAEDIRKAGGQTFLINETEGWTELEHWLNG